jgi:hypothetical protein
MADLLDHRGDVDIGGRLGFDKTRLQTLGRAAYIDAFKEDNMEMEVGVRPRLHLMA